MPATRCAALPPRACRCRSGRSTRRARRRAASSAATRWSSVPARRGDHGYAHGWLTVRVSASHSVGRAVAVMLVSRISPPALDAFAHPRKHVAPTASRPRTWTCQRSGPALRVDCEDNALRAELARELLDQLRTRHRGAVDRDLVRSGIQNAAHPQPSGCATMVNGMKTSSAVRRASSTIVERRSCVAVISRNTSSSAPPGRRRRELDRVTRLAQLEKARALTTRRRPRRGTDHALQLHSAASPARA